MQHSKDAPSPLQDLINLLGTKWNMHILWALKEKPLSFRALQSACGGISPSVLNQRLSLLEENLLIDRSNPRGYALTPIALDLLRIERPLSRWARRWQRRVEDPQVDAGKWARFPCAQWQALCPLNRAPQV